MRRHLAFIKHPFRAVFWLAALMSCLEVGLRIHSVCTPAPPLPPHEIPVAPSATLYYQLPPMASIATTHAETGEPLSIEINSLGLRGPEPTLPKPPGLFRILCLGDETTFGCGLHDEETFSAHLQQLVQQYQPRSAEVINAGVPGYCPLLSFLQFRHCLMAYDPDAIVITFDMDDVADDYRDRPLTQLDPQGIPLVCRNPVLDAAAPSRQIEENFVTVRWLKQRLTDWNREDPRDGFDDIDRPAGRYAWLRENPPDWSIYVRNALEPVRQLRDLSQSSHPLFLLAVCPAPWQISGKATNDPAVRRQWGVPVGMKFTSRKPFLQLEKFARDAGIDLLDVSHEFERLGNPEDLYLPHAPRLSSRGHQVFGGLLARWILPRIPTGSPTAADPVVRTSYSNDRSGNALTP